MGLYEIQLVHNLSEVVAGLGRLAEGEAFGVEVGHVACVAVALRLLVAYCRLIPDYREWPRTLTSQMKRHSPLLNLLADTIEGDRYPFSSPHRTLRGILAKFKPMAPPRRPPARPRTPS